MSPPALQDTFGLVGKTLEGQYRVEKVIGEGGFGVVYRGWHLGLEQPVAIKLLKVFAEDQRVQAALLDRFKEEAKLLYTLSQSSLNIVRSIDYGGAQLANGVVAPYMVLEWLEGRSLAEDLEDRRRRGLKGRSLDEALAILAPAAEGLAVAHARRVAHRDIKPANIFLVNGPTPQSPPNVKVLDFGIAKITRENETGGTKSPFASFTYLYAAPEQLDPRLGATGLATDVYSFALVLTELLTDRMPVEGRDVVTILKAVTDPTLRPTPNKRGASIPESIEAVCRRALAVDPGARFPNIMELRAALADAASRAHAPGAGDTLKSAQKGGGAHGTAALPAVPPSVQAGQRPSYAQPVAAPITGPAPYGQPPTLIPYNQVPPPPPVRYWPAPMQRLMPQNNSAAWITLIILLVFFGGCTAMIGTCAALGGN